MKKSFLSRRCEWCSSWEFPLWGCCCMRHRTVILKIQADWCGQRSLSPGCIVSDRGSKQWLLEGGGWGHGALGCRRGLSRRWRWSLGCLRTLCSFALHLFHAALNHPRHQLHVGAHQTVIGADQLPCTVVQATLLHEKKQLGAMTLSKHDHVQGKTNTDKDKIWLWITMDYILMGRNKRYNVKPITAKPDVYVFFFLSSIEETFRLG